MNSNITWSKRLKDIMPWGSSTCSKAAVLTPEEPTVIVRGNGCRIWDADGHEYIDFRNSLGPITLGYRFGPVDDAIRLQLDNGIIYGHPSTLECEVAELMSRTIPCAERVRFLKTGSEAVAACIRIARHYTGRDHIIQIGYNGWLNSLAAGGATLPGSLSASIPAGVPKVLSDLHHASKWNDIEMINKLFDEFDGQIAAVIVSADYARMELGAEFYPYLRDVTREKGSLLIFDEIVTGFRIAVGGVQEYFKVTPDMAVFGKGMANGMPISVYCGSKQVMTACEKGGAVISSTFGGETLSLAAAKATVTTYQDNDVVNHLWRQGQHMWGGLNEMFIRFGIPMELKGFWPCPAFRSSVKNLQSHFFRAAFKNGVSLYGVSYVNYSHSDTDIEEALTRLEKACREIT